MHSRNCDDHCEVIETTNRLWAEADEAAQAGDKELAWKRARQIQLLEDSVIVYSLWTPPRSLPPLQELKELEAEVKAEADTLLVKNAGTKCPGCLIQYHHRSKELLLKLNTIYEMMSRHPHIYGEQT